MEYRYIDMEHYARKSHFEYFLKYANPYMGMTVNIDVTRLKSAVSQRKESFFLACLYAASKAANEIPEFRQRILDGAIIEYGNCLTSHTVALSDGTYNYCSLNSDTSYDAFMRDGRDKQLQARNGHGIPVDEDERALIFVSCVPWEHYTSVVQPTPYPADSNPRITFGGYSQIQNTLSMPVTVLCNHALVDGLHVARFYAGFRRWIAEISNQS